MLTSTEVLSLILGGAVCALTVRPTIVATEPKAGKEIRKCGWNPCRRPRLRLLRRNARARQAAAELRLFGPFPSGMVSV